MRIIVALENDFVRTKQELDSKRSTDKQRHKVNLWGVVGL